MKKIELQPFPTYVITYFPLSEIQFSSRKTINKNKSAVVIQEEDSYIESKNKPNGQVENKKNDVLR